MNKLWSFLKSEYRVFITLLFVCSVFGGVFLFAGLNMEYFVLGLEIILFALFIFLVMEWFSYVKKEDHRLREQMIYIEEYTNMAMNYLKLLERTSDMDIYEVDLDIIISSIVKKYSLIFIEKKILLDYTPTNEKVISDAKWLSIMLEQIISNALKYTKSGKISINFDKELLKLSIKDTGIGIPSKDIKKIFDRGYSGFNGRVNEKSSGLGLYMVGKIAQILNIKIEVYSKLNIGSEFNFIFK